MNKAILVVSLFAVFLGTNAAPTVKEILAGSGWRIVGGKEAEPGQFPYIVSIRVHGRHICGGAILNEEWILTAAHCLVGQNSLELSVVAGSNLLNRGGVEIDAKRIITHTDFNFFTTQNDIGLIQLREPLTFGDNIKSIKIHKDKVEADARVTLCGWGLTSSEGSIAPNELQYIDLKTISFEKCYASDSRITEKQICTLTKEGEGACQGDSGGPLTMDNELIGVVSWGVPCAEGYPDVFTNVAAFDDWIQQNMNA